MFPQLFRVFQKNSVCSFSRCEPSVILVAVRRVTNCTQYTAIMLKFAYVYTAVDVCTAVFNLDAGLLAISQYSEGPATGHLDTGFSLFLCVYKQMLRWYARLQVATTCFSCSPPDLNLLVTNFIFCIHVK